MQSTRRFLIWGAVIAALVIPFGIATRSPLLAWRDTTYILAGFAGIAAMSLLFLQPLLAGATMPSLPLTQSRKLHRLCGGTLLLLVIAHVVGLWITSPPDVVDALLFRSPTPFSVWGVLAMWAVFMTAALAALWLRFQIPHRTWRRFHGGLAIFIATSSVAHALLIEGTMGQVSKAALCALVIAATLIALKDLRVFRR